MALAYAALLVWYAALYRYTPYDFVHVGTIFSQHDPGGGWGYDGQFYYYVARDPATAAEFLDNPAYRLRRIVYPLVVRALALGQADAVPLVMLLVNVAGVAGGTELLGRLLAGHGASRWYSLGYGLAFGQAASITHQLADPLGGALLAVGIWLLDRGRAVASAAAFGLAALTRDSLALVPLGYLVSFLLRRKWRSASLIAGLGLAPLGLWTALLEFAYPDRGVDWAPVIELLPLQGMLAALRATPSFALTVVLFLAPAGLVLLVALRQCWQQRLHSPASLRPIWWAWAGSAMLLVFLAREQVLDFLVPARLTIGVLTTTVAYAAISGGAAARALSAYFAAGGLVYVAMVAVGASSVIP